MGKMIESNIQYELYEVQGKLFPELQIIHRKGIPLQLTPYGIATLAKQLSKWAIEQSPDCEDYIKGAL